MARQFDSVTVSEEGSLVMSLQHGVHIPFAHTVPTPLNTFPASWHWHCGLTVQTVPSQHAPSLQDSLQSASVV
jgi:hypothetical protein